MEDRLLYDRPKNDCKRRRKRVKVSVMLLLCNSCAGLFSVSVAVLFHDRCRMEQCTAISLANAAIETAAESE